MIFIESEFSFDGEYYGIYTIRKLWHLYHIAGVNKTRHNEYVKAFGENLRKIRSSKGFTMMQLAFEADIEYSQIAKIERGVTNTTISTAYRLSNALSIPVHELFRFEFPPKAKK